MEISKRLQNVTHQTLTKCYLLAQFKAQCHGRYAENFFVPWTQCNVLSSWNTAAVVAVAVTSLEVMTNLSRDRKYVKSIYFYRACVVALVLESLEFNRPVFRKPFSTFNTFRNCPAFFCTSWWKISSWMLLWNYFLTCVKYLGRVYETDWESRTSNVEKVMP